MIDVKTLNEYSRFVNMKQICDLAEVSYTNVKHKVQRFKAGRRTKLNDREAINLTREFKALGKSFHRLDHIKI